MWCKTYCPREAVLLEPFMGLSPKQMVQILPAKQKGWWQELGMLGLKMLLPLLHGNNIFLLIKRLWGGDLQVTNLIRHYPYTMLYRQLHSNLSAPLIRWHNEIAAYLIYQVIFSCHLLVSKNKLLPGAMAAQRGSELCPLPLLGQGLFLPPKSGLLLQPHTDSALPHGGLVCKTSGLLLSILPWPFLPLCSWPGTFRRHHSMTLPPGLSPPLPPPPRHCRGPIPS